MTTITDLDQYLRLDFSPTAIREHFDEAPGFERVAEMSDDELRAVGNAALCDEVLYQAFHEALVAALD